jgi:biopolymer transport protein TolR
MQFQRKKQALSDINVTPLVDVMLVLLVIFMVTAPMMEQGIEVNLPETKGKNISASNEEPFTLTVKKDGTLFLNREKVNLQTLREQLKANSDKMVYLKSDETVAYGYVAQIMGELKELGIEKIGLVTVPLSKVK